MAVLLHEAVVLVRAVAHRIVVRVLRDIENKNLYIFVKNFIRHEKNKFIRFEHIRCADNAGTGLYRCITI